MQKNYENIRNWLNDYLSAFTIEDVAVQHYFDLKSEHLFRVEELVKDLGRSLDLEQTDMWMAQSIALLHDIGSFQHYIQHGSLLETDNLNHAELGVAVLKNSAILQNFKESEQEIICGAVSMHSLSKLPKNGDKNLLFFTQLLQDADKLDVFRIITDCRINKIYISGNSDLKLSTIPAISKKVYESIMDEKLVDISSVITLNDYKLFQMSWVFSLNFRRSYRIVNEKAYLKQMYDTLPKKDEVIDMYRRMRIFLENRL